jgi:sugar phosphate isomerase/epimerase
MNVDDLGLVKFAIGTVFLHNAPLEKVFARIASAGFAHVELMCEAPHLGAPDVRAAERVRDELARFGLSVATGHGPYLHVDCGIADSQQRRHSVAHIASFIAPLSALGAACVVVHPNRHTNREDPRLSRERTRESLKELADHAAEHRIRIALENVPFYGRRRVGDSVGELLEIIGDLPAHVVGICLDTGHAVLAGRDPVEELKTGGQRIFHLHLQDNDGRQDLHRVPGDGVIEWDDFVETMARIKFSGSATIEVVSAPAADGAADLLDRCRQLAHRWNDVLSSSSSSSSLSSDYRRRRRAVEVEVLTKPSPASAKRVVPRS